MRFVKSWQFIVATGAAVALAGCGEPDDAQSDETDDVLFETAAASADDCPGDGTIVTVGTDSDGDGTLSDDEIDEVVVICDGEDGEDGEEGPPGADSECVDHSPLAIEASLEDVDSHYRAGNEYTLEITTSAAADELDVVVAGDAIVDGLSDNSDGVEGILEFTAAGASNITVVASDGCGVDVDNIEVFLPVYGPSYEQLEAGWMHTCGLRSNGSVTCWGEPSVRVEDTFVLAGQLDAPDADDFVEIDTGVMATCGLHEDGSVSCWGQLLDLADMAETPTPINAPEGEFDQISVSMGTVCGLRTDGTGQCLNDDTGLDLEFDINDILDEPDDESIVQVHDLFSLQRIIVLLDNREAYRLDYEEDSNSDAYIIEDVARIGQSDDLLFEELDVQAWSICGIDSLDRAICYTEGEEDTINVNDTEAISAGGYHGCALYEDGDVQCLGPGVEDHEAPHIERPEIELDVPSDTTFQTDVAAGITHSCAITEDDLVTCWGLAADLSSEQVAYYPSVTNPIQ